MTDYSSVKSELLLLLDCKEDEIEKYNSIICGICDLVFAVLNDEKYETDSRIIHFAAAKCYYQLLLFNQSDEVTSFKAGDVSYSASSSAIDKARALYEQVMSNCCEMIKDSSFDFRAV
ncbi:MAG: hypothetical protein LUG95_07495 [Clostridiales bacterium]|nr:hypothetical protein [Clostridiales bacterium]